MHYSLLLLIAASSGVISIPVDTTKIKSRSGQLGKRQSSSGYCNQGTVALCCSPTSGQYGASSTSLLGLSGGLGGTTGTTQSTLPCVPTSLVASQTTCPQFTGMSLLVHCCNSYDPNTAAASGCATANIAALNTGLNQGGIGLNPGGVDLNQGLSPGLGQISNPNQPLTQAQYIQLLQYNQYLKSVGLLPVSNQATGQVINPYGGTNLYQGGTTGQVSSSLLRTGYSTPNGYSPSRTNSPQSYTSSGTPATYTPTSNTSPGSPGTDWGATIAKVLPTLLSYIWPQTSSSGPSTARTQNYNGANLASYQNSGSGQGGNTDLNPGGGPNQNTRVNPGPYQNTGVGFNQNTRVDPNFYPNPGQIAGTGQTGNSGVYQSGNPNQRLQLSPISYQNNRQIPGSGQGLNLGTVASGLISTVGQAYSGNGGVINPSFNSGTGIPNPGAQTVNGGKVAFSGTGNTGSDGTTSFDTALQQTDLLDQNLNRLLTDGSGSNVASSGTPTPGAISTPDSNTRPGSSGSSISPLTLTSFTTPNPGTPGSSAGTDSGINVNPGSATDTTTTSPGGTSLQLVSTTSTTTPGSSTPLDTTTTPGSITPQDTTTTPITSTTTDTSPAPSFEQTVNETDNLDQAIANADSGSSNSSSGDNFGGDGGFA